MTLKLVNILQIACFMGKVFLAKGKQSFQGMLQLYDLFIIQSGEIQGILKNFFSFFFSEDWIEER